MREWFDEAFAGQPMMAILRGFSVDRSVELAQMAWELGITVVEVPVQSAAAVEALRAVARAADGTDGIVGAGTVTTEERVTAAAEAGARFTVAPGLDLAVAAASHRLGMAHLPGVATASEITSALRHRMTWLKAFPAAELGTGWFTAQHAPFPEVRFVATGGIGPGNARAFLSAGAEVVAVGSVLNDPAHLSSLAELLAEPRGPAPVSAATVHDGVGPGRYSWAP